MRISKSRQTKLVGKFCLLLAKPFSTRENEAEIPIKIQYFFFKLLKDERSSFMLVNTDKKKTLLHFILFLFFYSRHKSNTRLKGAPMNILVKETVQCLFRPPYLVM